MKLILKICTAFLYLSTLILLLSCKSETIELGVKVGPDIFSKEVFFSDTTIGHVTAITMADSDSLPSKGILIVGNKGSTLVDLDGKVIHQTIFDRRGGRVVPVFNAESQSFDYLNRGGGWQPVSFIDTSGKTILKISEPSPNDAVLIDVNNDEKKDLVMGSNASGGLLAFDLNGEMIWKKNTVNSFDVEVFEEDNEMKIVHVDKGKVLVRTRTGELEYDFKLPFDSFDKGFWPGSDKEAILGIDENSLKAYNIKGDILGSYPIENEGRTATTIALRNTENEEHLGLIVCLRATSNRSEFYVFNKLDSLIYHEAIEARYPVVESITNDESDRFILVGGSNGVVWKYKFK